MLFTNHIKESFDALDTAGSGRIVMLECRVEIGRCYCEVFLIDALVVEFENDILIILDCRCALGDNWIGK
jgi:hypothetical protein